VVQSLSNIPQQLLDVHNLTRTPLMGKGKVGKFFEFPSLLDLLGKAKNTFESRELLAIDWDSTDKATLKMPRLKFIDEKDKQIAVPSLA
jgi:hypothetical protein